MTFKRITLIVATVVCALSIFSQGGSYIQIHVINETLNHDYECTAELKQDAAPTAGSLTFTVPASTGGPNCVTEVLEFEEADICLNKLTCVTDAPGDIGIINVKCGDGLGTSVPIAPRIFSE